MLFFNFHMNGVWRSNLSTTNFCVFPLYPDSISITFKPLHNIHYRRRFHWEIIYHLNAIYYLWKRDRLVVTFSTSRSVSAYANVVWECFVLMNILTDVIKLTTLTPLTQLFHTGLEAFSVFHVVLKFPTRYSCGS
jgi:hypothetical protein